MKLFKKTPLNSRGISHILVPLLVVFVIAAIGSYVLKASHADTPTIKTNSPNSNLIISVTDRNGDAALYTSNGTQAASLLYDSHSQNSLNNPTWVSGGSFIDYLSGGSTLFKVDKTGASPTNISLAGVSYSAISYSNMANKLAYESCIGSGSCGLYVSNADGSGSSLIYIIPNGDIWLGKPSWSPNGKKINIHYFNNQSQQDYSSIVNVHTKSITPLDSGCGSWSGNNRMVCGNSGQLVIFSTSGKQIRPIPNTSIGPTNLPQSYSVSPDGKQVAYTTRSDYTSSSTCRTYRINIDGTGNQNFWIAPGESCPYIVWASDNSMIAVGMQHYNQGQPSGGDVRTVNANGQGTVNFIYGFSGGLYGLAWGGQ